LINCGGTPVDGPRLNIWRAPTDNDNGMDHHVKRRESAHWARARLDKITGRLSTIAEISDVDGHGLMITTRYAAPSFDRHADVTITWRSDGVRLSASVAVELSGEWPPSLPRIGLDFAIDGGYDQVSWAGHGPGQKYPDTGQSARLGYFSASVDDLQVPYARPQENGARQANRLTLSGEGRDITIGGEGFGFAARPWSQAALASAEHIVDLVPDGRLHLTIDHRQQGIGTASCGPGVLPAYTLDPSNLGEADLTFSLTLE
jgi:beta-galactosidase